MNSSLEKEINALLDLLDDPDYAIFESVSNRFLEIGIDANQALENAWSLTLNDTYQKRIEYILDLISQKNATKLANMWLKNNPDDLLEGYLAFSRFQYPSLDVDFINKQIDNITKNIWLEINNQLTSLEKTRIINHILFQILRFKPVNPPIESSKNFYLNQLLQTKTYTSGSISLLYLIIAQKLEIPIYGIVLKQILLLCYVDFKPDKVDEISENNILFYIDASNGGNIISKEKLKEISKNSGAPISQDELLPKKPVYLINSIIKGASEIERGNSNFKKAEDLLNFAQLLSKLSK